MREWNDKTVIIILENQDGTSSEWIIHKSIIEEAKKKGDIKFRQSMRRFLTRRESSAIIGLSHKLESL